MRETYKTFWSDESGATAIEYGLIASLVSIVAIAAFRMVGTKLSTVFTQISGNLI
jgi:pilus assembly protein Flp/PilA